MLVLSRKVGETIVIGEKITVTVVAINGNKIRLGIEAPREMLVDREEVHKRIKTQGFDARMPYSE